MMSVILKNIFPDNFYDIYYYDDYKQKHISYNMSLSGLIFIENRYGKENIIKVLNSKNTAQHFSVPLV